MRAGMTTPRGLARTAGVLYLCLVGAAFNEGYVLPRTVKSGDAAATAGNIRASATLFRVGFAGDLVAATQVLAPAVGPGTAPVFIAIGGIAEVCFLAWLLIKAVNVPAPGNKAPAPARRWT